MPWVLFNITSACEGRYWQFVTIGGLVRDCCINISMEMSNGWVRILLFLFSMLSRVELTVL